jgi:hypothetical protein
MDKNKSNINKSAALSLMEGTDTSKEIAVAGPLLLAQYLRNYGQNLISDDIDTINICIAGASCLDVVNNGKFYELLPTLYPAVKNKTINITFVGLEVDTNKRHELTTTEHHQHDVCITTIKSTLQSAIEIYSFDMICLNHPGLEENNDSWLSDGLLFGTISESKTIVVGCSYGVDEASIDRLHAKTYDIDIIEHKPNEYALKLTEDQEELTQWAKTIWRMENSLLEVDFDDYYEFVSGISKVHIEAINEFKTSDLAMKNLKKTIKGKTHYWIGPGLTFIREDFTIVDEEGYVAIKDIELDKDMLVPNLYSGVEGMYISSMIRHLYHHELCEIGFNPTLHVENAKNTLLDAMGYTERMKEDINGASKRIIKTKGMFQNPTLIGSPLIEMARDLNIEYNENYAMLNPGQASLALLSESINVFKDCQPKLPIADADFIAQYNINDYVDSEHVQTFGVSNDAYMSFMTQSLQILRSSLDTTLVDANFNHDFENDKPILNETGIGAAIYNATQSLVAKAIENKSGLSDRGVLIALLAGVVKGFRDSSELEDVDILQGFLKTTMESVLKEQL